jgi:hypothetical protein
MRNFSISTQLILSLIIIFGLSVNAHGKQTKKSNTTYKVEKCDCLGFSDDIPTFLSDLPGAEHIDIQAEGKSIVDAEKSAQNMCVETYRNYASTSSQESSSSVTQTGCQIFKTDTDGSWVSI